MPNTILNSLYHII